MLKWTRIREDFYNGVARLRKGLLATAIESAQEVDRLKLRFKLHEADERLSESYRALGEYVLMKLGSEHHDFAEDQAWRHLVREIDARRAEREKLASELKSVDQPKRDDGDSGGH